MPLNDFIPFPAVPGRTRFLHIRIIYTTSSSAIDYAHTFRTDDLPEQLQGFRVVLERDDFHHLSITLGDTLYILTTTSPVV